MLGCTSKQSQYKQQNIQTNKQPANTSKGCQKKLCSGGKSAAKTKEKTLPIICETVGPEK